MTYVPQRSLNGGEIADAALARIDLAHFQAGLRLCQNWIAEAYGGITNRPGLPFVGDVTDHDQLHRLVPFSFSVTQTYILVLGDEKMRVVKDGALVLESSATTVTAVTKADPGVFTSVAHGYSDGDQLFVNFPTGMVELHGRYFHVANKTTDTYQLARRDGTLVDTTDMTTFIAGTMNRVFEATTPWASEDLHRLTFVQSHDVLTVSHPDYVTQDITRTDHDAWTFSDYTSVPQTAAPENLAASTSGTADDYVVTAFDEDTGEESVASDPDGGNGGDPVTLTWDAVSGADLYGIYKDENGSGVYGFIGLSETTTFKDHNIAPEYSDTPPKATDPFDDTDKYPAAVGYYEQRQVFGGTNARPTALLGSRAGLRKNHAQSSPKKAGDAFNFTLFSGEGNPIRHLLDLTYLLVFTGRAVLRVKGRGDESLGVDSVDSKVQVRTGSSYVPPVIVGAIVLYVLRSGRKLYTLSYKLEIDGLDGDDMTALAPHLFETRTIKETAYAEDPYNVLWVVCDDGVLLGFTFLPEHRVYAWHRHVTDGFVESVASVVEGAEDAVYVVTRRVVQQQTRRYIERFATRRIDNVRDGMFFDSGLSYNEPVDIESITLSEGNPPVVNLTGHGLVDGTRFELDDVVGCDDEYGSAVNGKHFLVSDATSDTFALHDVEGDEDVDSDAWSGYIRGGELRVCISELRGLDHLEGEAIGVLADGNVLDDRVVVDGMTALNEPSARVHAGLRYESVAETLPLTAPPNIVPNAMQGIQHVVSSIDVLVRNTRGLYVEMEGSEGFGAHIEERTTEDWDEAAGLFTGVSLLPVADSWSLQKRLRLVQSNPLPATVLSVTPEVVHED